MGLAVTGATRAGFGWSPDDDEWVLRIVRPELELSPLAVSWPETTAPPGLMERYDALATLGYAVVEGGPKAWTWAEAMDDEGRAILIAYTEVRPLRADELPAAEAGTDTQRTG